MLRTKTFTLPATQTGLAQDEFDLGKEIGTIIGISLSSDQEDLLYYRGATEIAINNVDVVVAGERSRTYMFSHDNPTRMYAFGELPLQDGERKLRVRHQDRASSITAFQAYNVEITLHYRVAA